MKTKNYLASANTGNGFINFFNNINQEKNSFNYIIKGGPGTGKSSLMKTVAKHFKSKGYKIEYFYCSSDATSLDGIRIKNISIVDGTAPHITECCMPMIDSKILNVCDFIELDLSSHRKKISNLLERKSTYYKNTYLYFNIIKNLISLERPEKIIEIANIKQISKFNFYKNRNKNFKERTLFSSYINEKGLENLYGKNKYRNIIVLNGNIIDNKEPFNFLTKKLNENNLGYTKFMSILNPDYIEAVLINSSNILFVSKDAYNSVVKFKNCSIINLLIKKIAFQLYKAKTTHKKIESYFISAMNFKKLSTFTNNLIKEIESKLKK